MKTLAEWIRSAIDDGSGHVSSSRLMALATVGSTVVLPALAATSLSLTKGVMVDIPMGYVGFIAAANAIVCAMFASNKKSE